MREEEEEREDRLRERERERERERGIVCVCLFVCLFVQYRSHTTVCLVLDCDLIVAEG